MAAGRGVNNAEQRKANARLAWILASAAIVFALGFVAKIWLFSH
ncbi:MAG TPA: cytochrome oxidase small assembly protein [Burkholderiaceae bacterium]|nr:cytochrome oxidase small assembly protein [Burkholderiaceae bacterium]